MKLEILPVPGIGEVTEGADLASLIVTAAPWLRDGDVLVVTSKIVSKAEGRLVRIPLQEPARQAARERILAEETVRVVARRGATRIVQTRHGFVMASAGIDASNVDPTRLALLPVDPDRSARELRGALRTRYGHDVAVIISDTMGRPWRNGLTDVALGVAGMSPVRDHRGEVDRFGNKLRLTEMAVVDELAGAAELVKGKCDQIPVAVIRGYPWVAQADDGPGARALVRNATEDLFALGTAEARAAGLRAAATLPEADPASPTVDRTVGVDTAAVRRAVRTVRPVLAATTTCTVADGPEPATTVIRCSHTGSTQVGALIRFGADIHRLRAALAAEGIGSGTLADPAGDDRTVLLTVGQLPDGVPGADRP